ncbi:MAG: hypothetical protein QNJ63_26465 [Calothrix sp. MO_192.B10]|nr:hypothetical protein [Calothrix sp. MO_192.B10]
MRKKHGIKTEESFQTPYIPVFAATSQIRYKKFTKNVAMCYNTLCPMVDIN